MPCRPPWTSGGVRVRQAEPPFLPWAPYHGLPFSGSGERLTLLNHGDICKSSGNPYSNSLLLRCSGRGLARRHDPEHEHRDFDAWLERAGNLVTDRGYALQECGDRLDIIRGKIRKCVPRHDRRQDATIRPNTGLQRGDNLLRGPAADAGLLVGRDVGPGKGTKARNFECYLRSAEKACHVGFAEEISWR